MIVPTVKEYDFFKRKKYDSGITYALRATGQGIIMIPLTTFGLVSTTVHLAADIAILPIRGVGKLFKSKYVVAGKNRKNLKRVLKIQEQILDGEETIYLKTDLWKKIYDGMRRL